MVGQRVECLDRLEHPAGTVPAAPHRLRLRGTNKQVFLPEESPVRWNSVLHLSTVCRHPDIQEVEDTDLNCYRHEPARIRQLLGQVTVPILGPEWAGQLADEAHTDQGWEHLSLQDVALTSADSLQRMAGPGLAQKKSVYCPWKLASMVSPFAPWS